MVSLGCPKNQVDAEILMSRLSKEEGFTLSHDPALSDVVIINTCGFIESAKQEAIDNILEYITLKKEGRIKKIIVTGCLAERYRMEITGEMPEASAASRSSRLAARIPSVSRRSACAIAISARFFSSAELTISVLEASLALWASSLTVITEFLPPW